MVTALALYEANITAVVGAMLQDVSGGKPVMLEGVDLPLWGLEVDVEEGKQEFASFNQNNDTAGQVRTRLSGQ